jgi:rhamnose transport system permease protein
MPRWAAAVAGQQAVLVILLLLQIGIFSITATNFTSPYNAFLTLHLSIEVCLLAVALTPVIVTGGIDLSVGSLLGLSAVIFGKLWRDGNWPVWWAAIGTLGVGGVGGLVNGLLITRLRIPPLIVTLGTFSLFRGLAEGITRGADNFTNFPQSFIEFGQGYFGQYVPVQLVVLPVVAAFFWVLLHRTTIGRALVAIGFSPEGARHAGIPVERRIALVYVLSGMVASLAAVVYVAHWGQAKADAGTGYELLAITAVVLGGTSIFGGRGSVIGTLLGWLTIAVLQQGLTLSDQPKELAGILTGALLIGAIVVNQLLAKLTSLRRGTVAIAGESGTIDAASQNKEPIQ